MAKGQLTFSFVKEIIFAPWLVLQFTSKVLLKAFFFLAVRAHDFIDLDQESGESPGKVIVEPFRDRPEKFLITKHERIRIKWANKPCISLCSETWGPCQLRRKPSMTNRQGWTEKIIYSDIEQVRLASFGQFLFIDQSSFDYHVYMHGWNRSSVPESLWGVLCSDSACSS